MAEIAPAELSPAPSRPEDLTVDFYDQPDSIVIHKRKGGGAVAFLLLWLIGWTVGCVTLAVELIQSPSMGMFAFAIPFWASWLFVAGLVVWMMFGKETLVLSREEAVFLRTAFIRLTSRVVPRREIKGFQECRSDHTENDEHLLGIAMITMGRPLRFAYRLPDRERLWLIYHLNRFLETSDPTSISKVPASIGDFPSGKYPIDRSSTFRIETLTSDLEDAEPPTDCQWSLVEDFDAVAFIQSGRWEIQALATLLFINAFWNGIVSVFVMAQFGWMPMNGPLAQGWEWWGMLLFLIPFEAIGLGMIAALLMAFMEPFRRTQWRFEFDRIVRQTRWPLYRRTRSWEVSMLERLEVRRSPARHSRRKSPEHGMDVSNQTTFELAFVHDGNVDLCSVPNLTEGEAQWMSRVLLEKRPRWFAHRPRQNSSF